MSASDLAGLAKLQQMTKEGDGYYKLQTTKPQTIAYSLTDSPIGLLSWIYEKLHSWSDSYPWTDDEILTWVSIYWFSTAGPGASVKVYYEMEKRAPGAFVKSQEWVDVPLGIARFEGDFVLLPSGWNGTLGPVVWERVHERGGHFAAWECPEDLVADLRGMFGRGGGAFEVVEGKSGFGE